MTDEEIVEAMAKFVRSTSTHYGCLTAQYADRCAQHKDCHCRLAAVDIFAIAKPLIAREAREMALKEAAAAVVDFLRVAPKYRVPFRIPTYEIAAAILALSNNPEVGG